MKFSKLFFFGKCRTVPIIEKGGPFLIYKHAFCCKRTKNSKGGPFGDIKKFSKRSRTVPKKSKRGDTLVSAGFVGYIEKGKKMKGKTLWRQKIFSKKVAQCRKKIQSGDSLVPSGFVGYLEKVKKKREGDLLHSVCLGPLAGLDALGGFRIVTKSGPISVRIVV